MGPLTWSWMMVVIKCIIKKSVSTHFGSSFQMAGSILLRTPIAVIGWDLAVAIEKKQFYWFFQRVGWPALKLVDRSGWYFFFLSNGVRAVFCTILWLDSYFWKNPEERSATNGHVPQWRYYRIAQSGAGSEPPINFLILWSKGLVGCAKMRMW